MKRVLWAAALVGVAIVGYQVHRERNRRPDDAQIRTQVESTFQDLKDKARAEHPDMPMSDAMKAVATQQANESLAAKSPAERRKSAANYYLGFHWSNTRARKDYCAVRGVDLGPFVSAFESAHASDYAKARAIIQAQGVDPEQAYPLVEPQMKAAIDQDMQDIARGANLPLEQACQLLNDNAEQVVAMIKLPTAVAQALASDS